MAKTNKKTEKLIKQYDSIVHDKEYVYRERWFKVFTTPDKKEAYGVKPKFNKEEYYEFLKSNYWQEVRKLVLHRDHMKCVKCGSSKQLNVHHKTYEWIFQEHKHLDTLETLCKSCHEKHHDVNQPKKQKPMQRRKKKRAFKAIKKMINNKQI